MAKDVPRVKLVPGRIAGQDDGRVERTQPARRSMRHEMDESKSPWNGSFVRARRGLRILQNRDVSKVRAHPLDLCRRARKRRGGGGALRRVPDQKERRVRRGTAARQQAAARGWRGVRLLGPV